MDINEITEKYLIEGFGDKPLRAIRSKIEKKLNMLKTPFGVQSFGSGRTDGNWNIKFDKNDGISLDADDWKQEISIYLYDKSKVEIEVTATGTDKRGRTDSELMAKRKLAIKTDEDVDKIIKFVKQQAKKHFKMTL